MGKVMKEDQLYGKLEDLLAGMETGGQGYIRHIGVVSEMVAELRAYAGGPFADEKAEIDYFGRVWPRFYGKLFYFQLLHRFWICRSSIPPDGLPALIRQEEERVARFFCQNRKFWIYYKSGSAAIAGQFTRAYSRSCIFDSLSYVLDQEAATLASHLAAKGLAFEEYKAWLQQAGETTVSLSSKRYTWNETKSAAVELIKSQAEAGSVSLDGKPATAAQLKADFEEKYNVDLGNFDNLLYGADTRKTEETPYLMKLVNAFSGRKRRLRK